MKQELVSPRPGFNPQHLNIQIKQEINTGQTQLGGQDHNNPMVSVACSNNVTTVGQGTSSGFVDSSTTTSTFNPNQNNNRLNQGQELFMQNEMIELQNG